jgi:protein-tyrosine phosphatase
LCPLGDLIVRETPPFVDIHCHLIPAIDDGAKTWDETLAMARMAAADGISTIVVTPHQLGNYAHNQAAAIRARTDQLQSFLDEHRVPLRVLPGADVRIESDLAARIARGEIVSLADHQRHILLELPHEVYFPIDRLLTDLSAMGLVGILSHPERNSGILAQSCVARQLVESGCLLQVTAGSLLGSFGPVCQKFCEWLIEEGLAHFVSTDAHGANARRPLLQSAFRRVEELVGHDTAVDLCCLNPAAVAAGNCQLPDRSRPRSKGRHGIFGRKWAR